MYGQKMKVVFLNVEEGNPFGLLRTILDITEKIQNFPHLLR